MSITSQPFALQVETAGDCYIVAGSLMRVDDEGFLALEDETDPVDGAERVMEFGKVREWKSEGRVCTLHGPERKAEGGA